jgi:hypothetical protein
MKIERITRKEIVEALQDTGHFFGAKYLKKNGEVTSVTGRFGVAKFTKGTGSSSSKVWTIWDTSRKRYTSLIPENVLEVTYNGQRWELV